MGDVEDPEIYAAHRIYEWQQNDKGKWAMSNAQDVTYSIVPDHKSWGFRVTIMGDIVDARIITEYYLRFGYNDN